MQNPQIRSPQFVQPKIQHKKYRVLLINKPSKLNKHLINFFKENLTLLNNNGCIFDWVIVYKDEISEYREQGYDKFPLMLFQNQKIYGVEGIIEFFSNTTESFIPRSQPVKKIPANEYDIKDYLFESLNEGGTDELDEGQEFNKNLQTRMNEMMNVRASHGLAANNNFNQANQQPTNTVNNTGNNMRNNMGNNMGNNVGNTVGNNRGNTVINNMANNDIDTRHIVNKTTETPNTAPVSHIALNTSKKSNDPDDEMMMKFWENNEETDIGY